MNRKNRELNVTRPRLQTIFNNAYKGILAQGDYAFEERKGHCRYKITIGTKTCHCAIGHSLPWKSKDKAVRRALSRANTENHGVLSNPVLMLLGRTRDSEHLLEYSDEERALRQLQKIHDESASVGHTLDKWKDLMHAYAKEHNLTVPEIAK